MKSMSSVMFIESQTITEAEWSCFSCLPSTVASSALPNGQNSEVQAVESLYSNKGQFPKPLRCPEQIISSFTAVCLVHCLMSAVIASERKIEA